MKIARRCICCESERLEHAPAVLMPFVAFRVFGWEPAEVQPDWGLRDLPAGKLYSVCRSMMCEYCGLLFLDMRFDEDEMGALYDDYRGPMYTAIRDRFEQGYSARNALLLEPSSHIERIEAFLEPHVTPAPRVLDWGGGTGINTPFRREATEHDVYDISNSPLVEGAHVVSLQEATAREYDLIVCSQVLEHLPYPRKVLRQIATAMNSSSILYIEVPHEDLVRLIGDRQQRLSGKHHWHEHINFFTFESLEAVLRQAGFRVVDWLSLPVTAGGREGHVFSVVARRVSEE
jgi:SAM-dependent methyltransferase